MEIPEKIKNSNIEEVKNELTDSKNLFFSILREDKNHPVIQGNKLRKLHYNLLNAKRKGNKTLLTFGGAYSNHLLSVACAGKEFGFETIGIVRGEKTLPLNYTLAECENFGMKLYYIDRTTYKLKNTQDFKDYLRNQYGSFYLLPEGGTNYYAVNGCMEIVPNYEDYDYICCPVGTGGTIAGITIANNNACKILGFPALKGGEFLHEEIFNQINMVIGSAEMSKELMNSLTLHCDFHFGGYAKIKEDLLNFVRNFYQSHGIKWDLIYNGKMAYGVFELMKQNYFPEGSKILLIHTGGLQGIKGLEERHSIKIYDN